MRITWLLHGRVCATDDPLLDSSLRARCKKIYMSTRANFLRLASAVIALSAAPSGFAQYTFTKIVDHSVAIPDASGAFTALYSAIAGEGMVLFNAAGAGGLEGAYLWNGSSIVRVADNATNAPGASSAFTTLRSSFSGAIVDGSAYIHATYSVAPSGTATGVYEFDPAGVGTLSTVIRRDGTIPGGGGATVTSVTKIYGGGGQLHFGYTQSGNLNKGVFSYDGATLQTTIAAVASGGSRYDAISAGPTSTDGAAFVIRSGGTISYYNGTAFTDIALAGQFVPGQSFAFPSSGNYTAPRLTGDDVYFTFRDTVAGTFGVYHVGVDGQNLSLVADTTTVAPRGFIFYFFGELTADNDRLVFFARTTDGIDGLYSYKDGVITLIMNEGYDLLDGRTVSAFALGDEGLNGDDFAFRVNLSDGTQAILYTDLAAIPEPASWSLILGVVAVGCLCRRRRG